MKKPSGPYADKLWREALRRAVLKRVDGGQKLDKVADAVVAKAMSGDVAAAREIGDRLDGKPTQAVEHGGSDDLLAVLTAAGDRARSVGHG